ncbi:MAG TPA: hypothetical protein PKW21_14860, partial [Rhabdaerophilum sp.]|nr:hypothetical protein [Rhabdaerophilum sp.]
GLAACQTTGPTVPQLVSFKAKDSKAVKGALALDFTSSNWTVQKETDSTLTLRTSQFDSGIGGAMLTCSVCRPPELEVDIVAAVVGDSVTVSYKAWWIVNPGSPAERKLDNADREDIQRHIKANIEHAKKILAGRPYT